MKRIYTIALTFAAALFLGTSCEKPVIEEEKAAIEITGSNLVIPAKGGDAYIAYRQSVSKPSVTVAKSWLSVDVQNDTIWFAAGENPELTSRYSTAVMTVGGDTYNYTIQQRGYNSAGFEPHDITAPAAASQYTMPYEYDEMMVASSDAEWITVTVTENSLTIALDENTAIGTPENPSRVSTVVWSLGAEKGVINVTQNNVSFMEPDSNWSVKYDGLGDYQGETVSIISNTVTDPAISGKYAIYYVDKADFTASGLEMNDYVAIVAEDVKAEIFDAVDYYAAYGYDLTFGDFLYEESDYEIFDPIAAGEYIAFAIGFTDDAALTGHYASKDFTVSGGDGPNPPATGYEAWLGEWLVPHGTGSKQDTWVFTENVKGQSYYVSGIEGYNDLKIEVAYDAATQSITAYAQEEIGTKTVSGAECSVGFYGATSAGNFWTPGANPYVVFNGKMNGDTATITPEALNTQEGEVTPELAVYIATTPEGSYTLLKAFADATKIPNTLTRKSQGGDDPNPPTSSTYEDWLGTWLVPHGEAGSKTDKWVFTEKVKGQTYSVTGIEGYNDISIEVAYDPDTKGVIAYAQEEVGTKTLSGNECSVGFYAATAAGNFWTPGADPYVVFTGAMNGKTAVLSPAALNTQEGEVTPELAVYIATTPTGSYSLLKAFADATRIPVTIKREDAGGDNPGGGDGGEGSANYKKWLGGWSVDGGAFEIEFSAKTADKTLNMAGWQIAESFMEPCEVTYGSDGSIVLYGNDDTPVAERVDIGADEGPCDLFYVGKFIYSDSKEYYITSGGDGAYDVATAKIGSDGKATFAGNEFTLSDGGKYTFNRFELIAVPISDPEGGVYTFNDKPNEFPLTATKAGSSSVKAMGAKTGSWVKSDIKKMGAVHSRALSNGVAMRVYAPTVMMTKAGTAAAVVETPVKFKRIK